MALSNMFFTNNLGTIELTRIMYSLNHRYRWKDDGSVKSSVDITVKGTMKTTEDEISVIHGKGDRGTLTLPNGTYGNIKLTNVTYENGIWAPWGTVTLNFSDDGEEENKFTITFVSEGFEYKIYNPTISVMPSKIRRSDKAIRGIDGWVRHQMGHDLLYIHVSGSIKTEKCELPEGLLEALSPEDADNILGVGAPRVCRLSDYFPEAKGELDINQVMITDAKIIWRFEDGVADLDISLLAPPQII